MNEARAWDQAGRKAEAAEAYLAAARLFSAQEADDDLALALRPPRRPQGQERRGQGNQGQGPLPLGQEGRGREDPGRARGEGRRGLGQPLHARPHPRREGQGRGGARALRARPSSSSPTIPLYAFRYAERLFLLGRTEKETALRHSPRAESSRHPTAASGSGPLNLAGQEALSRGDLAYARLCLEAARAALPAAKEPAINLSDLESREGQDRRGPRRRSRPSPRTRACRNQAGNALRQGRRVGRARRRGRAGRARGGRPRVPPRDDFRAALRGVPGQSRRRLYGAGALFRSRRADQDGPRPRRRAREASSSPATSRGLRRPSPSGGRLPPRPRELPEDPGLLAALGRCYLSLRNYPKAVPPSGASP